MIGATLYFGANARTLSVDGMTIDLNALSAREDREVRKILCARALGVIKANAARG